MSDPTYRELEIRLCAIIGEAIDVIHKMNSCDPEKSRTAPESFIGAFLLKYWEDEKKLDEKWLDFFFASLQHQILKSR